MSDVQPPDLTETAMIAMIGGVGLFVVLILSGVFYYDREHAQLSMNSPVATIVQAPAPQPATQVQ